MGRPSLAEDLTPISEFRVHTAAIVAKVRKNRRPIILTQHGRSAAVLEDVRDYEMRLDRLELLEEIVEGIRAAGEGRTISHTKAMAALDKILRG